MYAGRKIAFDVDAAVVDDKSFIMGKEIAVSEKSIVRMTTDSRCLLEQVRYNTQNCN